MQATNNIPLYWDERDFLPSPPGISREGPLSNSPKANKTVIHIDLNDYVYDDEDIRLDNSFINEDGTTPILERKDSPYSSDLSELYRDKEPIRVRTYEPVDRNRIPPILLSKLELIDDVASKGLIYNLLSDPRRGFISSTGKGFLYRDAQNNVVTLKGITAGLSEMFWPDLDFSKIKRTKPTVTNNTNVTTSGGGVEKKKKTKKRNKLGQIASPEDFIKIQSYKNNSHKADILNQKYRKQLGGASGKNKIFFGNGQFKSKLMGLERGKRLHEQIDDVVAFGMQTYEESKGPVDQAVRNLFYYMDNEWNWVPLLGETPVYDLRSRRVTAIDIIAYDRIFKRVVLVEVKTGYDGCFENGEKPMKMLKITNSPLNQATVQLVATAHMFLEMFDSRVPVRCCVVWLNSAAKVSRYWVDSTTYENVEAKLKKYFFVKYKDPNQKTQGKANLKKNVSKANK